MNEFHPAVLGWLYLVLDAMVTLGCSHLANIAIEKHSQPRTRQGGGIAFSVRYWLVSLVVVGNAIISYSYTRYHEMNFLLIPVLFTAVFVTVIIDFYKAKIIRSVVFAGVFCGISFAISMGRGLEQVLALTLAAVCGFAFHFIAHQAGRNKAEKTTMFGRGDILVLILAGSFLSLPDYLPVIIAGFFVSILLGYLTKGPQLSQFMRRTVAVGPGVLTVAWLAFLWRSAF